MYSRPPQFTADDIINAILEATGFAQPMEFTEAQGIIKNNGPNKYLIFREKKANNLSKEDANRNEFFVAYTDTKGAIQIRSINMEVGHLLMDLNFQLGLQQYQQNGGTPSNFMLGWLSQYGHKITIDTQKAIEPFYLTPSLQNQQDDIKYLESELPVGQYYVRPHPKNDGSFIVNYKIKPGYTGSQTFKDLTGVANFLNGLNNKGYAPFFTGKDALKAHQQQQQQESHYADPSVLAQSQPTNTATNTSQTLYQSGILGSSEQGQRDSTGTNYTQGALTADSNVNTKRIIDTQLLEDMNALMLFIDKKHMGGPRIANLISDPAPAPDSIKKSEDLSAIWKFLERYKHSSSLAQVHRDDLVKIQNELSITSNTANTYFAIAKIITAATTRPTVSNGHFASRPAAQPQQHVLFQQPPSNSNINNNNRFANIQSDMDPNMQQLLREARKVIDYLSKQISSQLLSEGVKGNLSILLKEMMDLSNRINDGKNLDLNKLELVRDKIGDIKKVLQLTPSEKKPAAASSMSFMSKNKSGKAVLPTARGAGNALTELIAIEENINKLEKVIGNQPNYKQ